LDIRLKAGLRYPVQGKGNYNAAADQFRVALKLNPSDVQVCEYLGLAYEQNRSWELAAESYKKGLPSVPTTDSSWAGGNN